MSTTSTHHPQRHASRTALVLALTLALAVALLPPGATPVAAQVDDDRSTGAGAVTLLAPATDQLEPVDLGASMEIAFESNRRWPFEIAIDDGSDDGWRVPGGDATGTATIGHNHVEVVLPSDLTPGAADVRVQLLTPGPVGRVVATDVAEDAVEVIDPDAPPTVVSTSFTEAEQTVGEPPVGWSEYRVSGNWAIRDVPRRLEADIAAGGRQGLMWDVPGDDGIVEGDVEVAGLVRGQTTGNALFQVALHATGDGTDYYYVDAWPSNGNLRINRLANNSFTSLASSSAGTAIENGTWYQVVLRREDDQLLAKLWPFGDDEPDDWQVTTTDTAHDAGRVGVTHLNEGTINDYAWFSVAIDGEQAERAPDDVFEPGPDAEVAAVEVTPDTAMLEIDDTLELSALAVYDDGNGVDVTTTADWASDDTEVASVTDGGVVTALDEGTATITATSDGVTGTSEITVVEFLPPTTGFEDRDGDGWTTHDEELDFLAAVAEGSERMSFERIATSIEDRPIHLVRVGYPEAPDDETIVDDASILAIGVQHGNEPAGREAALEHLRDLAFTDDADVLAQLDDVTMLYIPTSNPDGREANSRTNADGIDTNRDHHTLETVTATAIAETVMRLDPEVVVDLHERPGGSTPDVELLWPRNLNVDEALRQVNIDLVQDRLRPALEDAGFSTGLYGSPTGAGGGDERIARNVFGLRHTIGLLTETGGQDPPRYRTDAQLLTLEQTLGFVHDRLDDVVTETTDARTRRQAHGAAQGPFYLDGRDDVSPPPADGIVDPGPCGYVLSADDAELIERHVELFGIEVETLDDGRTLIRMDQPMMTIVPFLVDPRAFFPIAPGLVADDCDDLPDPPEPDTYTTSFTEPFHEVGEQPVGWRQFRTSGNWSIRDLPRRLEARIASGGRQGLMWSEPANLGLVDGDVEVAGLVRGQTTGNALFQVALHATGDGTDYYYVDAWPSNGNLRINRIVDDSFSSLASSSAGTPVENGAWYQVVFRREGDQLMAKLWPFGDDEPDGWQVTTTDTTHQRGQVGVTHLNQDTVNDWAWFSVGTGGLDAERAPDDVFEPGPDAELARVDVSPSEAIARIGGSVSLSASAVWDDGNGTEVTTTATWTSADEDVATVSDDGVVTGVGEGTTEITATYEGVTGTATFVVDQAHVETREGSHDYGIGQLATSEGGMVAAADGLAADVGAQMLEAGGNAVDAAVATAFALTVVEPSMSHLGGRAQLLIRLPDGEYVGIDGGTEVPSNYRAADAPPSHASGRGYGTIALPGVVAALTDAHDDHGELPLDEVLAPAIELATDGFALPARQADFLSEFATVSDAQYEAAQRYFLRPDGSPYRAGDTLVQEDLAGVLEAIADDGGDVFYEGWIAEAIAEDMEAFGGFLNEDNLGDYATRDGVVLDGSYGDHDLYSLYDPSRGQVTIQALQMMEHFDMDACAPDAGWASIIHQAYRIGMDDRSLDPEVVTSKEHAAERAEDITDHCDDDTPAAGAASTAGGSSTASASSGGSSTTTASSDAAVTFEGDASVDAGAADVATADVGVTTTEVGADELDLERDSHTTHIATADPDGMAVTLTQTIGPALGSMVATDGLGFLYASTMGYAGSTPGTRPSTNLTPMIVERDGELAYVLGAAGGAQIVTAVLMTLTRTFTEGGSFPEALASPRLHPSGASSMQLEDDPAAGVFWPDDTREGLQDLGYSLSNQLGTTLGRIHAVEYDADTGVFRGVADPRREGRAAGPAPDGG